MTLVARVTVDGGQWVVILVHRNGLEGFASVRASVGRTVADQGRMVSMQDLCVEVNDHVVGEGVASWTVQEIEHLLELDRAPTQ